MYLSLDLFLSLYLYPRSSRISMVSSIKYLALGIWYLISCIWYLHSVFAQPHNAEETPGIRQSGRLRSLQSSLCKAEKHLHADPKPAQTMHKSQVVLVIIYM